MSCWSCGALFVQQRRKTRNEAPESTVVGTLRYMAAFVTVAGLAGALAVAWMNEWSAPVKTIGLVLLSAVVAAGLLIYVSDAFEALARRRSSG